MIVTKDLKISYDNHRIIIDRVSLSIPHGKITALIGPNGCGKSTLLKAICRIIKPICGAAYWKNTPVTKVPTRSLAQHISLLPQSHPVPEGITAKEIVSYGRNPYMGFWGIPSKADKAAINSAIKIAGIQDFKDNFITELSGGQIQRVWLAMILAQDTDYILLDEPTTFLDINRQVELMQLLTKLNSQGKTIIVVLHDINQASRYCDHIVVMKSGNVMEQGAPKEVMTKKMLKTVFEVEAEIYSNPISGTPMSVICS